MSEFAAEVREIEKVWPHSNANKLSLAKVKGLDFQFVTMLDEYKPGDLCVYLPVDSVLKPELITKIGLDGKLGGKAKNRVKTIKLRKEISQGICIRLSTAFGADASKYPVGTDVTTILGITKYDPEVYTPGGGNRARGVRVRPRPTKVPYYDIESTQRNGELVEKHLDDAVVITEKLEGMNIALLREKDGTIVVCSRNCQTDVVPGTKFKRFMFGFVNTLKRLVGKKIPPISQHYEAALNSGWVEKLDLIAKADCWAPGTEFILRGEVVGPDSQGNIYKLPKLKAVAFDIQVLDPVKGTYYLDWADFYFHTERAKIETTPVLFKGTLREYLGNSTFQILSTGPSAYLPSQLREGIVIKLQVEKHADRFGRVYFKMRSPEYLAENDN